MIQPLTMVVPYRRPLLGQEPSKPGEPEIKPADVPFYLEPIQAVTEFRSLVADSRNAIKDIRIQLGSASPVVKTALVVAAGSAGLIALVLLADFIGLNPFRKK